MPFGLREDLTNVTVIISGTDGQKVKFTFDKMTGGKVTAKDTKYRPGNGTEDEVSLGGSTTVDNITVTGQLTYDKYLWLPWLFQQAGKADMWVNRQPLDHDGNPFGKALSYKGKLIDVEPSGTDSMSDAANTLMLTQSSVTPITTG